MVQVSVDEAAQYAHSPPHAAILRRDYFSLRRILAGLPRLPKAGEVRTEAESILAEQRADAVSAAIDRRDVPNRETPLHVAVRLGDATAVELLMAAGADWSLQNAQGWSALQEAVCAHEEKIATIIIRHYRPMAWAKWCRRLPRLTAIMHRMRDFYMEFTFHFESSVIPFIGRIAPSDTYKIWKRGANLRADMTLAGFDGFKIQRSDQSFLFLGDGSNDGKQDPGMICILTHREKEVMNALEGGGAQPSEAEIAREVASMSKTNMYRPGIDVTQADLVPQLTWRRQEKTEMVGSWKAKLYDMHHVTVSVRSRRVTGAMTDEELSMAEMDALEVEDDDYGQLLTEDEKRQLQTALTVEDFEFVEEMLEERKKTEAEQVDAKPVAAEDSHPEDINPIACTDGNHDDESKKGWFGWNRKIASQDVGSNDDPRRNSVTLQAAFKTKNNSDFSRVSVDTKPANFKVGKELQSKKTTDKIVKKNSSTETSNKHGASDKDNSTENEYRKGLRPTLWLTPDFPMKTDELLPLLDILANKVKAVRRLRELLTMKLPSGTFPVKIAIPVVPTIRVIVTFTKFEELCASEEFSTPVSSPVHLQDPSSSWFSWINKDSHIQGASTSDSMDQNSTENTDPFLIPNDYVWIDVAEKKRRLRDKKNKNPKGKKPSPQSYRAPQRA
ncbi:hypothetical protein O6H91_11G068800 [Diphasiastrum complanatum]|uniref:Uncharacterized protein n=2 Tax=Diphasiastrum complanatum TaxID=34168 RepID=A0ACC2CA63_DIPCM|nr:hypothetical protein O6H91_11G068800 [Diphasiastrum complanatum]KAJ7538932.1 hypothetical protein O6H91_11G068800 [Diphasiastrum complanatum]